MIGDFWTRHRFFLPVLCLESSFPGGSLFPVSRRPGLVSQTRGELHSEQKSGTSRAFFLYDTELAQREVARPLHGRLAMLD